MYTITSSTVPFNAFGSEFGYKYANMGGYMGGSLGRLRQAAIWAALRGNVPHILPAKWAEFVSRGKRYATLFKSIHIIH